MRALDQAIQDLDEICERLLALRDQLKKVREEVAAVEKARDALRGRGRSKRNGNGA